MKYRSILAVGAAAAVTVLSVTSARADTVYNDLDGSIDAAHETMSLTYDMATNAGSSGTTRLRIQIDGHPAGDHPGCNIQGGPHYVSLLAHSGNTAVATVSLPADRQFDSCTDSILATVTAKGVGSTGITFTIDQQNTGNDPNLTFSLAEAAFNVNVVAGTTGGGSRCDADPAAPAWAAAILKANDIKPGSRGGKNYISEVAGAMTKGAVFATYAKNAHPQYENAVLAFLNTATGKSLVMGKRPGWICRTIS